ncbi:MAG: response regulator transcription factor [Bacteroidetes bacterium]|nr:response regulator transcription factor [Bacteroidota bacterium]
MIRLNTVIVEDIPANREALKTLLKNECPNVKVLGEAGTIEEAEKVISQVNPNLVFLDIEIRKATSFDLLDKLHKENAINFEIIFFTAHGRYEYATRAIEFSALDFLSKPVDPKKLRIAVEKAAMKLDQQQYKSQVELLLETLSFPNFKSKRIAFHLTKSIIEFVEVDTIIYLEADSTITHIHLEGGNMLSAMRNMGHYSKLLLPDHNFFPISNSLLINLDFVKRYNHNELAVSLINGQSLYASRRGGKDFKRFLSDNKGEYGRIRRAGMKGVLRRLFGV